MQTYVCTTSGSSVSNLVAMSEVSADGLKTWQTRYRDASTAVVSSSQTSYGSSGSRWVTNTAPDGSHSISAFAYGWLSVVQQKVIHPAYQRIIGMGRPALPMIFKALHDRQEHWMWALRSITGEEAAAGASNFKAAAAAWLAWGKLKGYL
jgi:hypothetical protein